MKRFHVHSYVEDLQASITFYSKMFAAHPTRVESGYANWMLEDPRVNFAISIHGDRLGVDHLGIQLDDDDELVALKQRAEAADLPVLDAGDTTCCYARSDRFWLTDPQGVAWEHFRDLAQIEGATCRVLCVPPDSGCRAAGQASSRADSRCHNP